MATPIVNDPKVSLSSLVLAADGYSHPYSVGSNDGGFWRVFLQITQDESLVFSLKAPIVGGKENNFGSFNADFQFLLAGL